MTSGALLSAKRHKYILLSFFLVVFVFLWLVTYGGWRLLGQESFGDFYDAQAHSILQGKLDVPLSAISGEAFIHDGKYYGYFGIGPAILRIPLLLLFPSQEGMWSRLFLLIACLLNLIFTYLLIIITRRSFSLSDELSWSHKAVYGLFIITIGLGTSNIFMASRSYIYHEAIILASSFALMGYYFLLRYLTDCRIKYLIFGGVSCFFSFFSRATSGAGILLCFFLLATIMTLMVASETLPLLPLKSIAIKVYTLFGVPRIDHFVKHTIIVSVFVASTFCTFMLINYAKFETFDSVPVKYYVQYTEQPNRMSKTQGKQIHFENLRTEIYSYFNPKNISFRDSFPWVYMTNRASIFPEATIDIVEPFSSFPASTPAIVLLSLGGLCCLAVTSNSAVKKFRLPIICSFIGGAAILVTVGITQRYQHDFYPFLVLTSVLGLHVILSTSKAIYKHMALAILVPASFFAIAANIAFALVYQREIVWGVPADKSMSFREFRSKVDGLFSSQTMRIINTVTLQPPPNPLRGQVWVVGNNTTAFWFDGSTWVHLYGKSPYDPIHIKIAFAAHPTHEREPIVTAGKTGAGDFVYAHYLPGGRMTFAADHWGVGGPESEPITVEPGRFYDLVVDMDRVNQAVTVLMDSRELLRYVTPLYPTEVTDILIGENRIGGTGPGDSFSGTTIPLSEGSAISARKLSIVASRSLSTSQDAAHAFDNDERTEWIAPGSMPVTLTITPDHPVTAQELILVSRKTTLFESWHSVEAKIYRDGKLITSQDFPLADAHKRRVQRLEMTPILMDRIELVFSSPVIEKLDGTKVDPGAVNPGYSEIFFISS